MPIEHRIDHQRRLVMARVFGKLGPHEMVQYQRTVWSAPEIASYDELVDMTDVEEIPMVSPGQMQMLATVSATMDPPATCAKFAIVAPSDLAFGLGRMYQAFRGLQTEGTKEVRVFRTEAEALAYLGIEGPLPGW